MLKWQKDLVSERCMLDLVDEAKKWLNYMRTKHPVEPFWWEDLIEKKRELSQEKQTEQAKDLANQVFQTF